MSFDFAALADVRALLAIIPLGAAALLGCSALTALDFTPPEDAFASDSSDASDKDTSALFEVEDGADLDTSDGARDADAAEVDSPTGCAACVAIGQKCCGTTCVASCAGCSAGSDVCGAECTNLSGDESNCGSCGRKCGLHEGCSGGACCLKKTYSCPGAVDCCGSCIGGKCT